jgi:hypothetical protein
LQSYLRIAQVGDKSPDLPDATILAGVAIFADLSSRNPHCRAQLFQVLAHFVHSDAAFFGGMVTQLKSRIDFFPENSLESFGQRFAQFQFEGHGGYYSSASRTLL